MLVTATYWLFMLLTALGKLVAFAALVVFTIALPLTRIQIALNQQSEGQKSEGQRSEGRRSLASRRDLLVDFAVIGFGLVGVLVMLENLRIFLSAH